MKVVDKPSAFAKVRLDPEFADYPLAEPLPMESDGAKLIRLANGRVLVLGIASAKFVGRWQSPDGTLLSVAIGGFLDPLAPAPP